MGLVVSAKNLNKSYPLFNGRLQKSLYYFFGRLKNVQRKQAISDISFDIARGEFVGIVGSNGGGKSTLLKLISGVAYPDSGTIHVKGSIAAILELGAGFNPELSGYDNILYFCAYNNYSQELTQNLLKNAIEFSELSEVIHMPVKKYSSGMFARLAFSVNAFSEAKLLIVDEALSVGDLKFQQKCYRLLRDRVGSGLTVIFVSHDLSAIRSFCNRLIWLNKGSVVFDGEASLGLKKYYDFMTYGVSDYSGDSDKLEFGTADARLVDIEANFTAKDSEFCIFISGKIDSKIDSDLIGLGVLVTDRFGNHIANCNSYLEGKTISVRSSQTIAFKFNFKIPELSSGQYFVTVALSDGTHTQHKQLHWLHDFYSFESNSQDPRYNLGSFVVPKDVEIVVSSIK